MNEMFRRRVLPPLCGGLVLLVLRLVQNAVGFDPATGLALSGRAGYPGGLLAVCVVLVLVCSLIGALRLPGGKAAYDEQFAPPDKELPAAVMGCLLMAAGGLLTLAAAIPQRSVVSVAAGGLAAAAGGGLLVLLHQSRAGAELSVVPLLPAAFFSVFFVLTVYLPESGDPVLARYYLPVLASAMTAYAFGVLAGFPLRESGQRSFVFTAGAAVPLCMASLADPLGLPMRLLFAGCAAVLAVFLLLCREMPLAPEGRTAPAETEREEPAEELPEEDELE